MRDGNIIMGEGGQNAPGVSDVAKQLAKQDLGGEGSNVVSAIIERVTTQVIWDRKKVAKCNVWSSIKTNRPSVNKYANLTRHSSSLLDLDNDCRVSIIGIVTVGV
jgi:hypothetical protein